jgi:hypothetical protein
MFELTLSFESPVIVNVPDTCPDINAFNPAPNGFDFDISQSDFRHDSTAPVTRSNGDSSGCRTNLLSIPLKNVQLAVAQQVYLSRLLEQPYDLAGD